MKAAAKALAHPAIAGVLISICVLLAVLGARHFGLLQRAEIVAYDQFLRWRANPGLKDDRIVICGMTEDDLVKYGHPLNDALLAQLLERLVAAEPCVIVIDFYRDLKEPRSGEMYPQLETVLLKNQRIFVIEKLGNDSIKPPPALADLPDRVVPNNLPWDYTIDGRYRRAYLVLEDGLPEPRFPLAVAAALEFFTAQNIEVQRLDQPDGQPLFQLGKTVIPRLTRDAGGYVNLPVGDYEFLMDFKGPLESGFPVLSFGDIFGAQSADLAAELKGKIILVAAIMKSVKDSNLTPLDRNLRGVVQHATIINQLLRAAIDGDRPMTWWSEWKEIAWIALYTFLGGALGLILRSPWKLAIALALLVGAIGLAAWQFFLHGTWVLVAAPVLGCSVAATFVTSFAGWHERAERAVMQTLFSKHVSTKVADTLWANRDAFLDGKRMRPKRVIATVLFTDLKSFSTTSEKMDAATLMDWMNDYMDAIGRHVEAHDGVLSKFIGDAIMGIFGAPISHEDEAGLDRDAVNAVECALAMEKTLIALNEDWTRRGLPTTEMRVGIFTGPLVTGSLGTSDRLEFTVLGDSVNTAARLESAGKEAVGPDMPKSPCTILIGASTFERLGGRYRTIPLGAISLKGKTEKISVHRVIGIASIEISAS